MMYDRFGHPGLFAAYHAGPARYARHLATGNPLPAETIAYLASVGGTIGIVAAAKANNLPPETIFHRLVEAGGGLPPADTPVAPDTLFLIRRRPSGGQP